MKEPVIIEFPSNLGLKAPSPGHEPGVKKLPGWLKQHGFYEQIKPSATYTIDPPPYFMNLDKESGIRNAEEIILYAGQQAELLKSVLKQFVTPVIIGGDCSILIGTALALREKGNYGLFYLDGHHDFMLPSLSSTGGAAGMDLAIVTGYGHEKLTNIKNLRPYLQEENIWCVGNREYDPSYVDPILNTAINYFDLPALRTKGMNVCVMEFLSMVETKKLDGYWIHFDVDALNTDIMPCVDSPEPDGLNYKELSEILYPLLHHPKMSGIEITILDPELDPDGIYTKEFVKQISKIL